MVFLGPPTELSVISQLIAGATPLATASYVIEEALAALLLLAFLFVVIVAALATFIFLDEARIRGISWLREGKRKLAAAIHHRLKSHGSMIHQPKGIQIKNSL